ncbi:MAG: MBOAT family protein [Gammaproteobacteria bacterium]|nr:MBOAT family protein [Gammaproteobacteria bacterium]
MLFNSLGFIFVFLPLTLLAYHLLCRASRPDWAILALITASLTFYGWWEPRYLLLITASVLWNYGVGQALMRTPRNLVRRRQWLLAAGITMNLGCIAWFKYAGFFVASANTILGSEIHLHHIVLPLAISFFTFQQIAYLVDTYRDSEGERSFSRYALFVTFFPQLIAGPIVHHKDMLPQFAAHTGLKLQNLILGSTLFFIGLFKKVIVADGVAPYSDTVFGLAATGVELSFLEAWTGALAYSLQLYFDFSGYSDMAIGLGCLFGIRLPLNFNSPYKACSIIDFWRRWHMTLSRFLKDYLYIPLGGSQRGPTRTYVNLMIVMLLGGLWHGAGWTFVIWGGIHGLYLLINHAWRRWGWSLEGFVGRVFAQSLTLLAVVVAWVVFRAESMESAGRVLAGMAGFNGVAVPIEWSTKSASVVALLTNAGIEFKTLTNMGPLFTPLRDVAVLSGAQIQVDSVGTVTALLSLSVPIFFALFWPNTQQWMHRYEPALTQTAPNLLSRWLAWRVNPAFAIVSAVVAAYACFGGTGASQFLYFQF